MKIAHVIPFFAPAWGYGGPVRASFDLTRELARRGHDVTVFTTDALDHSRRIDKVCEVREGVTIRRFGNLSNALAKNYNLFLPRGFAKYCKTKLSENDVVHLHSFYTFLNVVAAKYAKKSGVPYILHLHEKFDPTREMGKSRVKKIFLALFGKKIIAGAKKIFILSQGEKSNLLKFDPKLKNKIEIVPNPAPEYQGKCSNKLAARKKYGLSQDDKVVLSLSRLSSIKGVDLLVQAFSLLVKKDTKFKLIIAGPDEGGQKARLEKIIKEKKIQDKVIFTGFADQKMKDELFCAADIFALFSRYESFGIVVFESLACGVPVCISKNVGVASEILKFGCGVLVSQPDNSEKSSKALKIAYNKSGILKRNCRELLKKFDTARVTDRLEDIYRDMVKSSEK